ncbi:MAG: hypothetical protein QM757_16685 [Paludibaculum sp.]
MVCAGPIGAVYAATHAAPVRKFGQALVAPLFQPLVSVNAPPPVEVVLRRKNGQLLVHLLNATDMQVAGDYSTVEFVPPLAGVKLAFGVNKPKSVTLVPTGAKLEPVLSNGNWTVGIPLLEMHLVAVVVT